MLKFHSIDQARAISACWLILADCTAFFHRQERLAFIFRPERRFKDIERRRPKPRTMPKVFGDLRACDPPIAMQAEPHVGLPAAQRVPYHTAKGRDGAEDALARLRAVSPLVFVARALRNFSQKTTKLRQKHLGRFSIVGLARNYVPAVQFLPSASQYF